MCSVLVKFSPGHPSRILVPPKEGAGGGLPPQTKEGGPGHPLRRACETKNQINTNLLPVLNPNDLSLSLSLLSPTHNTLSSSHSFSTAFIGLISSSNPKAVFAIPVCLFPLSFCRHTPPVSLLSDAAAEDASGAVWCWPLGVPRYSPFLPGLPRALLRLTSIFCVYRSSILAFATLFHNFPINQNEELLRRCSLRACGHRQRGQVHQPWRQARAWQALRAYLVRGWGSRHHQPEGR